MEKLLEGLSHHARFLTREERKDELRERGIDVDGFLNDAHSIIAHHRKAERLTWMKEATEKSEQFSSLESRIASWVGKSKEDIMIAFQKVVSTISPQHTLAFRNKTDLSVEDMARILDDYERLRAAENEEKSPKQK